MTFDPPCRTTKYPREIPALPWYRGTGCQMLVAGFLPFSAIYIELYYIFTSVWGHMDYTIYSVRSSFLNVHSQTCDAMCACHKDCVNDARVGTGGKCAHASWVGLSAL